MKKRVIIIFTIYIFLLGGCSKEILVEYPQFIPEPVISCLFTKGQSINAFISYSYSILSNSPNQAKTVTGLLIENDIIIDTLIYEGKYLGSKYMPTSGNKYEIQIFIDSLYKVSAYDILPFPPIYNSLAFRDSVYFNDEGYPVSEAVISISDAPNIHNYYEIDIKALYAVPFSSDEDTIAHSVTYQSNYDPILVNEGMMDYYPESIVFSDALFDGKENTIHIRYSKPYTIVNNSLVDFNYDLLICIRSISENYYKYKKQLAKHLFLQQGDIWDGVGEPVQMYTNITGGLGIFSAYNEVIDTVYKYHKKK